MKKALLRFMMVMAVVLLVFGFSAASCTVTPAPTPTTYYTMSVTNQSGVPLRLEIHDDLVFDWIVRSDNVSSTWNAYQTIQGEAGYYFRVRNMNTDQFLQITVGKTWWYIAGNYSFTVEAGGWATAER